MLLKTHTRSLEYCFAGLSTFILTILALIPQMQIQVQGEDPIAKSPYESGYDHGCSDSGISDFSDRYINQPERDPSFHTDEFMRGYDAGYNACSLLQGTN